MDTSTTDSLNGDDEHIRMLWIPVGLRPQIREYSGVYILREIPNINHRVEIGVEDAIVFDVIHGAEVPRYLGTC